MLILIIAFAISVAIAGFSRSKLRAAREKFDDVTLRCGLTGAETAQALLEKSGVTDVIIQKREGLLTNHYNPAKKILFLSADNHDGRSIAAVGMAAHEVGHALQDAEGSKHLAWRLSSIRTTLLMSSLFLIGPIVLAVFRVISFKVGAMILMSGWSGIMLMNVLTLAVEFDASRRVSELLNKTRLVRANEEDRFDEMLNAAALYYVGAMLTSAWVWIYHLVPLFGKSRV